MYFAMDEIGLQNTDEIKRTENEPKRWRLIFNIAKEYGFDNAKIQSSINQLKTMIT